MYPTRLILSHIDMANLGQATGVLIYGRNLYFIARERRAAVERELLRK